MIVHLNGRLLPREQAFISPFDRGFVFGDGLYEGLRASAHGPSRSPRIVGMHLHVARLAAGLKEARIAWNAEQLGALSGELLRANNLTEAFVYWQITRGAPTGDEPVRSRVPGGSTRSPALKTGPTVLGYCAPQPSFSDFERNGPATKSAISVEDPRWSMGYVKSISLMGNIMASLTAADAGVDDAILVRSGRVVEGLATNVFVVTEDGRLVTPSLESAPMLAGVTRAILLDALPDEIECRPVTTAELEHAREVILCGSMTMVASVTQLDGRPVGDGQVGPQARRLLTTLIDSFRSGRDERVSDSHMTGRWTMPIPHAIPEPSR